MWLMQRHIKKTRNGLQVSVSTFINDINSRHDTSAAYNATYKRLCKTQTVSFLTKEHKDGASFFQGNGRQINKVNTPRGSSRQCRTDESHGMHRQSRSHGPRYIFYLRWNFIFHRILPHTDIDIAWHDLSGKIIRKSSDFFFNFFKFLI